MKVADLIAAGSQTPLTIKPSETVGLLARKLQQNRVGVMVVSHDGTTVDGIISERDIAYSLAERRGELHLLPVSTLMTRRVITCTPDHALHEVMHMMRLHHIRHVPVVHEGRLTGIVSIRDLMEHRLKEMEQRYRTVGSWLALAD